MDEDIRLLTTSFESEELVHRRLWCIVERNAALAAERAEGSFYPCLVAQVFAFHVIEAYFNFVGERIAPAIWKDERNYFRNEPYRGWDGKLRKVMDLVGLASLPENRPLSTVIRLKHLRDLIAHGKSERITGTATHTQGKEIPTFPPSALTEAVALREELPSLVSDVEEFLDSIHVLAAPIVEELWPASDTAIWFGQQALRGPAGYGSGMTTLQPRD